MHVPHRVIRPHVAGSAVKFESASTCVAEAKLPTRHGEFTVHVVRAASPQSPDRASNERSSAERYPAAAAAPEHVALVRGDVLAREGVLVRVHSECMTSEVFGSLKCDCKEQLDGAMSAIGQAGLGAVLYLRQEGRGIGLANKIRAYALQAEGHDTVDANRLLGLPDDARRYDVARDMLSHLGIASVRLLTNNPSKVAALRQLGVRVVARVPLVIAPNQHSAHYLEVKRLRMDHALPDGLSLASNDAE